MKLLYYVDNDENSIDEIVMAVPDDYDQELADDTAAECLNEPALEDVYEFDELLGSPVSLASYRPYVG